MRQRAIFYPDAPPDHDTLPTLPPTIEGIIQNELVASDPKSVDSESEEDMEDDNEGDSDEESAEKVQEEGILADKLIESAQKTSKRRRHGRNSQIVFCTRS